MISKSCLAVLIPILSALPACQLVTKASGTTPTRSAPATDSSSDQSSSGSAEPTQPADNGAAKRAIELDGVSIAEATRLAKVAGFEGKVKVAELDEYDAECKPNIVCRVQPINWRGERELTLYTNKTMTISVPD